MFGTQSDDSVVHSTQLLEVLDQNRRLLEVSKATGEVERGRAFFWCVSTRVSGDSRSGEFRRGRPPPFPPPLPPLTLSMSRPVLYRPISCHPSCHATTLWSQDNTDANSKMTVRFEIKKTEHNNGLCRLDLRAAVDHLFGSVHTAAGHTPTHAVVDSILVEAVRNTHPTVDVCVKSNNQGIQGNYQRTSSGGVNTRGAKDQHVLYVIHAGTTRTCTPPASVHQASPFCTSQVFQDFHMALDNKLNFEQYASPIAGTDYIEFVSPDLFVKNGVYEASARRWSGAMIARGRGRAAG